MSLYGSTPDPWADQFNNNYVPLLLELIINSWKTFQIPSSRLENPITRHFCIHLRNNKDRDKHFFRIEWESSDINKEGNEQGRIDLKFMGYGSCDERVYFSIECKRLRVTFPKGRFDTLAREYVKEGMIRYFNGQYATGLNKGGMLGYVMDGNTQAAIADVKKSIESKRSHLCMKSDATLETSEIINNSCIRQTLHSKQGNFSFTIHHIFLPI